MIRETHIANPTFVTRVARQDSGNSAVTVREDTGERVVYVNNQGAIVPQGATQTTTTTTRVQAPGHPVQNSQTTTTQANQDSTVVTWDQVQQNQPRYQLIEKRAEKKSTSITGPGKR